jgi:hypothetical protein
MSSYGPWQTQHHTYNLSTCAWHINSQSKLDELRKSWKSEQFIASTAEVDVLPSQAGTLALLKAWGEELYHHTVLLLERAISISAPFCRESSCTPASSSDLALSAQELIQSFSAMHEAQVQHTRRALSFPGCSTSAHSAARSLSAPLTTLEVNQSDTDNAWRAYFYPIATWMPQHALFSAGITLISSSCPLPLPGTEITSARNQSAPHAVEDRVRQCISLLRSLEADRDTLSIGLASTLEGFYMSRRKPSSQEE